MKCEFQGGMSTALPLFNYTDANGAPVCPICGRPILREQAALHR
jgi:hypothetical protein